MKAKLHTLIGTTMLGLALFSPAIPVWSGQVSPGQVMVGPAYASGSMAGARYSADTQQYIGCHFGNASTPFVICEAKNSIGQALLCSSIQPRHVAAAKAITNASRIVVSVAANPAVCDNLYVENFSDFLR